jgi:xanthine dehydrogenase accessory factor
MDPIVSAACERLAQGGAFVMATIIHQQGSSPRTAGTRMFITPEQQIVGTIGGGLLEAETMRAAARMTEQAPACFLDFDLTNEDAASMEMICGGRVRVLLDYIQPSQEHLSLFTRWRQELSNGGKAMLVSRVFGSQTSIQRIEHALLKCACIHGRLDVSEAACATLRQWGTLATHVQVLDLEDGLIVADPGQTAPRLYIFGAGHVARPTAQLAAMVGFAVVIIDDRAEFADAARFPEAAAVHAIAGFDAAFKPLTVNSDSYIIIVTRGHLHDRSVLA